MDDEMVRLLNEARDNPQDHVQHSEESLDLTTKPTIPKLAHLIATDISLDAASKDHDAVISQAVFKNRKKPNLSAVTATVKENAEQAWQTTHDRVYKEAYAEAEKRLRARWLAR